MPESYGFKQCFPKIVRSNFLYPLRYLHLLLAVLFILFAYWQLNDPDWPQWVIMYGFVAATAAWTAFAQPPKWWPWIGIAAAVIGMLSLIPDFINWIQMGAPTIAGQMKAEAPHIELTREFFGLAICLAALLFYARRNRRTSK